MPITYIGNTSCSTIGGACCLWSVPSGVSSVTFELWGGGGGGSSGSVSCDCMVRTGSGSGGGYAIKTLAVTAGSQYTVCAGAGGIDAGSGWGAPAAACCSGCNGANSFVTGTGITTLCASGGTGGLSNILMNCYATCGCSYPPGGGGYGGDINFCGQPGIRGPDGSSGGYSSFTMGGAAGGPGGGAGGMNNGGCFGGVASTSDSMQGKIPGGGGAGIGCGTCCNCCNGDSGRGGHGAVRIHW